MSDTCPTCGHVRTNPFRTDPVVAERINAARRFVREILADGPVSVLAIREAAHDRDIRWPDVKRAKIIEQRLSYRSGFGRTSVVYWS